MSHRTHITFQFQGIVLPKDQSRILYFYTVYLDRVSVLRVFNSGEHPMLLYGHPADSTSILAVSMDISNSGFLF
jgi:hypothetical protein